MSFEKFIPKRVSTPEPAVTISLVRTFWINSSATREFFEGFSRTFLLYDRERKVIGLEPTNEQKHSYALSKNKARVALTVSGLGFLKYYEIPCDKTRIYKATWNDKEKLVEIDLSKSLLREIGVRFPSPLKLKYNFLVI